MKIYRDIIQQSEEWYRLKADKLGASNATAIANQGKGLDTEINDKMAEYFASVKTDNFTSQDMDRGNELEPIARSMYELEYGVKVEQVGFVEFNDFIGCSPDGLINDDGGLEIKSPKNNTYFKILTEGEKEIPSDYIWQCQMNLLITERKYWKLMFYNPNFKKSSIVFHIEPDPIKFEKLRQGFIIAEEKIKLIKNKYQNL